MEIVEYMSGRIFNAWSHTHTRVISQYTQWIYDLFANFPSTHHKYHRIVQITEFIAWIASNRIPKNVWLDMAKKNSAFMSSKANKTVSISVFYSNWWQNYLAGTWQNKYAQQTKIRQKMIHPHEPLTMGLLSFDLCSIHQLVLLSVFLIQQTDITILQ